MSKVLAHGSAGHQLALLHHLVIRLEVIHQDVNGRVDQADGNVEQCRCPLLFVGNVDWMARQGRHACQGMIQRRLSESLC